jgi:hypothetical protein
VERVFGWIKHRFSSLHGELRLDIEGIPRFIVATLCMWNYSLRRQPFAPDRFRQPGRDEWNDGPAADDEDFEANELSDTDEDTAGEDGEDDEDDEGAVADDWFH